MREFYDLKQVTEAAGLQSSSTEESTWIREIRHQVQANPCLKHHLNLGFDLKISPLLERQLQVERQLSTVKPQTWYWEAVKCFQPKLSLNSNRYVQLKTEQETLESELFYWTALKKEAKRLKFL